MANTNTPVVSSHQHRRLHIEDSSVVPSATYQQELGKFTGVPYYNCMPKTYKQVGRDPVRVVERRPSAMPNTFINPAYSATSDVDIRGAFFIDSTPPFSTDISAFLSVVDTTLFSNETVMSTLFTAGDYVGFDITGIAGVHNVVILENSTGSSRIWVYTPGLPATLSASTSLGIPTTGNPVFLNGRVYVLGRNSQRIYNSAVGSLTSFTTANDFIDAEMYGDRATAIAKHKNHIVVFGLESIEFFYDAGIEIGSPLQRQEAYTTRIGTIDYYNSHEPPPYIYVGSDIYFVGKKNNAIGIYLLHDFNVTKVSSPFIDTLLNQSQSTGELHRDSIKLLNINVRGRNQLLIQTQASLTGSGSVGERLFCYDQEENEWAEWSKLGGGAVLDPLYFSPVYAWCPEARIGYNYILGYSNESPTNAKIIKLVNNAAANSPTEFESFTSSVVFQSFDDNNAYYKHIKYVDIIGDMGGNTITLDYIKDLNTVTYAAANDSAGTPIRFRNLGRGRKFHFKVNITGRDQIEFRGIDISYNQGTH